MYVRRIVLLFLGYAASYILEHEFGANWKNEVKTVFAGDDTTDEDIMRV
jgi:trehalose-6-phosphatase